MSRSSQPVSSFLSYLQFEKRYSSHTIMAYEEDLQQFFTYLQEQFNMQEAALKEIAPSFSSAAGWLR